MSKIQADRLAEFFDGVSFAIRHPEAEALHHSDMHHNNGHTLVAFNKGLQVGHAIRDDVVSGRRVGLTVTDIIELELEGIRLNHFI